MTHRAWQEYKYKRAYTINDASELVLEFNVCLWSCPWLSLGRSKQLDKVGPPKVLGPFFLIYNAIKT